jgi:hypothetical protein
MRDADVTDLYDRVGIGTKVVVLSNDQRAVAIEDRQDVAVERSAAGTMTARISVRPAVAVTADVPRPRTEWTGNPHPFGLY